MVKKLINILKGHYYNIFNKKEKLYNERILICNKCDNKTNTIIGYVCNECGCPLNAKTRVDNEKCNLSKW